ncbi:serine/threonine-protein kinase [Actinoplanes sp. NPDC049316]|uniref:serine/threonine-protein kinase n=1 Tax=Actinoplanes sp. NPDC049316 TaxID=3154727 RepID=UPI00341F737F
MDVRYQLRDRIGVGGMSVVWRAHDEVLGRDVAVKVLSATAAPDPAQLGRIRLEARAAAGLRHPNIVEVYDYGESSGGPYVVMELVEGETLADVLAREALPWRTAVLVCAQVAAALAAAHARGVVHRDVKPGNVMVTAAGVKLLDFGISAAAGAVDETDGEVLGTPAYLAPERLDGGPVRPASDVYGLGLLLHRALAGRMPWRASTVTEMVRAHVYTEPAPLPRIDGLPPEVADLARRCLAKRPEDRPDAAEAARVLGTAAGLAPLLPAPGPATGEDVATVAVRPPLTRRRRAALLAAAVVVPAVAAASAMWPSESPVPVRAEAAAPATSAAGPVAPKCAVRSSCTSQAAPSPAPKRTQRDVRAVTPVIRTAAVVKPAKPPQAHEPAKKPKKPKEPKKPKKPKKAGGAKKR